MKERISVDFFQQVGFL